MSKEVLEEVSMEDIIDKVEESIKSVHKGDVIEGEVISVSDNEILVNIGYITDGIIKKEELSDEDTSFRENLKPGDKIQVYVLNINDGEGNVALSKKKADEVKIWKEIEECYNKGFNIDASVREVVKGGVIAYIKGSVKAFIPASHVSISYVKDLKDFLNKTFSVKIIEFNKHNKKVVLSRKDVEKEELEKMKEKLWNSLKKGEKREGIVRRLTNFGAFVDLGGVDGLIHNCQLSWKRVNHPSEIVKQGDRVEVYVIDFDRDRGKISLSLKDLKKDPWESAPSTYKINDIVDGKVVKLLDFGAFVELESGIEGLVHITEITNDNIAKPSEILKIGDKVKVKIMDINYDERKISLSIKEAENEVSEDLLTYKDEEEEGNFVFKDLLKNLKF